MKRNYAAFIVRVTGVIIVLNFVRYYAVKGIKTHGNLFKAFNSLFPWDSPLSSTLKIITIGGSIALLVVMIKGCINGLRAPRLNWKEGLNALASVIGGFIGIICLILLYITIWAETKNHITAFILTGGIFILGAILLFLFNDAIDWIVWKFREPNNDEYYEEDESDDEY